MEEAYQRDKTAELASFDVRLWLNELTGVERWTVGHTYTSRKVEFVAAYTGDDGSAARVTMRAVATAGPASWELVVYAGDQTASVVIPARTRIKW